MRRQGTSSREKKTQMRGARVLKGGRIWGKEERRWHKRQVWEGRGCRKVHLTCPPNCIFKGGSYPLLLEPRRAGTPDMPGIAKQSH